MNVKALYSSFKTLFGDWTRSLDRGLIWAIFLLIILGILLIFSASPDVAERVFKSKDSFHFVKKQLFFLVPSIVLMLAVSMMSPKQVKRMCLLLFIALFALLILTPIYGMEVKGAKRWLSFFGFSFQPSEFMKPVFAVVCALFFEKGRLLERFPGARITAGLYAAVALLLVLQPDVGMTITITAIWACELFLAGLPVLWLFVLGGLGAAASVAGYFFFPHVQSRIDRFLNPETGDTFQVKTALDALKNGGWFGRGPGEGIVKARIPDAHTDFILAVAAEEYGFFLASALILIFLYILVRGFWIMSKERNFFCMIATAGLLTQFGVQAFINMASTLSLIPTKGMTLPFISYGGSSLLSLALGFGIILSLTRKRPEIGENT